MPLKKQFSLLIIFSILSFGALIAQPSASFTATPEAGCVGEVVNFQNTSDLSGCSGNVTYAWDFDNGATSNLENTQMTFVAAGLYNVGLTVSCDEGSDIYYFEVEILPTPVAGFTVDTYMGCGPHTAQFTNTSTQGGGTIDEFSWTFGDGVGSTESDPEHEYVNPGSYSVTLVATNANGCFDVFEMQDVVQVSDTPSISFLVSPQSHCEAPVDVFFDATVNVSSGLGYTINWDFGDGSALGTDTDITHSYTSQGDFDIQVTVTDDYGCQRTVDSLDYIHIHPVTPEYQIFNSSSQEITNGVVCMGETSYFSCENEGYSVLWDFGGGMTSTIPVASIAFSNAGTQNISMTVDPGGECEQTVNFSVEVEDATPSFTMDPSDTFACNPPLDITFTSTSSVDVDTYSWLFGDGNGSSSENPTHSYTTYGTFYPALEITSVNGCVGTFTTGEVIIQRPDAAFTVDTTEGCVGLEVTGTYSEGTDPADITNYSWDFADASQPPFDGTAEESHIYNTSGEYSIELTVTDLNGCTNSSTQDIQVGDHQNPLFEFEPLDTYICPKDSIDFTTLSTVMDSIDEFEWLFGDTLEWQWGTETGEELTDFQFDQDTGWIQVVHVVNHNGCRDSLFVDSLFYVGGPIVHNISTTHDCDLGNQYVFYVDLLEATEWDWIIENESGGLVDQFLNTTDSTLLYTFPADGEYMVHVIASNTDHGCEFEDSVSVNVLQPQALFSLNPLNPCAGIPPYAFDGSASINAEQYYWDFGDGETTEWSDTPTAQHTYNYVGDVNVTLHVMDVNGCEDSLTQVLHIVGPEISIDNLQELGCTPYEYNLTGTVTAEDNIILIEIEIGTWDTVMDVSALGQMVIPIDITTQLQEEGSYNVTVTARTNNCPTGNTVVLEDMVILTSIEADFSSTSTVACLGETIQLSSTETNPSYTYEWDFGDGETSNEMNPEHTYDAHGSYTVSLSVSDAVSGCVSDVEMIDYIEIQEAILDFTIDPVSTACPPLQPDIVNNSPGLYGVEYDWFSGYNESSEEAQPEFTYNHPGEYTLTVTATTSHGCTAEAEQAISVNGPSGDIEISDNEVCLHEEITFNVTNQEGVDEINWTFGDGAGFTGASTTHAYTTMPTGGTFQVVATLSSAGCDVQYDNFINVFDVHAQFSLTDPETSAFVDTFSCSPMEVSLIDISSGDDLSYTWTIEGMPGTYSTADVEDLLFVNTMQSDSIIDVTLAIENATVGCADDTTVQLVVGYIPEPNITSDTVICQDDSFNLHAEGGGTYLWYPGLYLSETEIANPIVSPEESMTYYLTVTGSNGCVATDSMSVDIQLPVITMLDRLGDTIVIGESSQVIVTTDQENAVLTWTPDLASISCLDCNNPIFNPEDDTEYYLSVSDSLSCFTEDFIINIVVEEKFTLDVPSAFTPEGHEINRVVYVRGYGIRNLKEFTIFNRWGEKLFTTDDINQGWDGYYNGKLQAVDTYVYYVEAEMYDGSVQTKKGTILLMQ